MSEYIPYTYCLYCKPINKWYYGVRYAQNCHPNEFWKTYFTSSGIIETLIITYGLSSFDYKIRQIFPNDPLKALTWEQSVLRRLKVKTNSNWLNQGYSGRIPGNFMSGKEAWNKNVPNIQMTGTKFYNNGEIQKMFLPGNEPLGWSLGRLNKPWNAGLTREDPRVLKNLSAASKALKGRVSWAKGLTKETDHRIRKVSETAIANIKSGKVVPKGNKGLNKGKFKGFKIFNNGLEDKLFFPGTEPEGWKMGCLDRIPWNKGLTREDPRVNLNIERKLKTQLLKKTKKK